MDDDGRLLRIGEKILVAYRLARPLAYSYVSDYGEELWVLVIWLVQKSKMKYSIIVPVYNRPDEVDELLESLTSQTLKDFEVVIVEDGSKITCKDVCDKYANIQLTGMLLDAWHGTPIFHLKR